MTIAGTNRMALNYGHRRCPKLVLTVLTCDYLLGRLSLLPSVGR